MNVDKYLHRINLFTLYVQKHSGCHLLITMLTELQRQECSSGIVLSMRRACGEAAVMLFGTTQIFAALLDILCAELFN